MLVPDCISQYDQPKMTDNDRFAEVKTLKPHNLSTKIEFLYERERQFW
jgi:hypothetical protein